LSHVSLATILAEPDLSEARLLSQFRTIFIRGFQLCPFSAFFSSGCNFINAALLYRSMTDSSLKKLWQSRLPRLVSSGLLVLGIVPYTLLFIVPVEEPLLKKEKAMRRPQSVGSVDSSPEGGKQAGLQTMSLLQRWNVLNYGRTVLPFAGMLLAWSIY
jgi:hypothetical protein